VASPRDFKLFPFQQDAAQALLDGALRWIARAVETEVPKYGTQPIPFLGQLRAVTGAGKTPILATVLSGVGDGVVLWTTKSSAVVEQTYINLRGKYRPLLGSGDIKIIREIPSQAEWRELITARRALTVWVLTTASWNEAESAAAGGSAEARLNLHRPQQDWAGDKSPWEQLRRDLQRPLWIVSDESHNQSTVQLDQLAALRPKGFFMASATPVVNPLFEAWQRALADDEGWAQLSSAGVIPVRTRDVVEAELLKTTIEVLDFNSGTEESLDGALEALAKARTAAAEESAPIEPRAIYVVEKSNPPRGSQEEPRPVAIWKHLRERGVPADEIAIYTDTREVPDEAERISNLSRLQARHHHIIFNQSLQEGWDDPEAYVCYFDGVTRSFVRIRQIVGRVLRQPQASRFRSEALNTATLIINTPAESYDRVLTELRTELLLYAPEDQPEQTPFRVKTRRDPLPPVSVRRKWRGKLTLPSWTLRAPDMRTMIQRLRSRAKSPWASEFLEAPGLGRKSVVSLKTDSRERTEYIEVLRSARTRNSAYVRRRLAQRNRACVNALHPDHFLGPAFDQFSCHGSVAQTELQELATQIGDHFEDRVDYQEDPDPDSATWTVGDYHPRGRETYDFKRSAHAEYARAGFNADELLFARGLDAFSRGVWIRNSSAPATGFGIPLPLKVGDSSRFYPDFLWWIDGECWAIDTTGRHLLNDKIRGKLIALDSPKVALVARGELKDGGAVEGHDGWTVVLARRGLAPSFQHFDDLKSVLSLLAAPDGK